MGLEIAEFLLTVEDEFDINIAENDTPFEAGTEVTVAMMVDLVERQVREKQAAEVNAEVMAADYPQKTLTRTTDMLAAYAEVPPESVSPDTQLGDLFTDPKRWQALYQQRIKDDCHLGDVFMENLIAAGLRRKLNTVLVLWGLAVIFLVPLSLHLAGFRADVVKVGTVLCLILSIPIAWLVTRRIIRQYQRIPPRNMTVGQLADAITAGHRRHLAADGSPLSRSAIEHRVLEILADTLGTKPGDIMLTDRLVQDLGMG